MRTPQVSSLELLLRRPRHGLYSTSEKSWRINAVAARSCVALSVMPQPHHIITLPTSQLVDGGRRLSLRTSTTANAVNTRAAQLFNILTENLCLRRHTKWPPQSSSSSCPIWVWHAGCYYLGPSWWSQQIHCLQWRNPVQPGRWFDHFEGKLLKFRTYNCFHPQSRSDQFYSHFYTSQRSRLGHGLNDPAFESRHG